MFCRARSRRCVYDPHCVSPSQALSLPVQYIVIRGALSADTVATLLAVANEMKRLGKGEKPKDFQNDQHALHWHKVYRDLIDHPLISPILSQLCGSAFRLDHVNVHARPATFPGGTLHGGDNPGGGNGFFGFRNGNFANGLVSVTYELEDTDCNPAGGGFCCILLRSTIAKASRIVKPPTDG